MVATSRKNRSAVLAEQKLVESLVISDSERSILDSDSNTENPEYDHALIDTSVNDDNAEWKVISEMKISNRKA
jgi:hypothetical protein